MFKKIFLKDHTTSKEKPLITLDIHSHLIPGIDDGAGSIQESVDMARQFVDLGYRHVFTTPHIMWDSYRNTPDIIRKGLEEVRSACKQNGISLIIDAAAEYYIDEHFMEMLKTDQELLTLPGKRLLVELPYSTPLLNIKETLFSIIGHGYKPVLAHPERYLYFHADREIYRKLRDQGCELQLNALSLIKHYGSQVQKMALWLLKENLIAFVGTDAHHSQHLIAMKQVQQHALFNKYSFQNSTIQS